MQFIIYYEIKPGLRNKSLEQIFALGDRAPKGIRVLYHHHSVTLLDGWLIVEASSADDLARDTNGWKALNVDHITPITDAASLQDILDTSIDLVLLREGLFC